MTVILLFISTMFINASPLKTIFLNLGNNHKTALEESTADNDKSTDYIVINPKIKISYDSLYEELNLLSVTNNMSDNDLAEQAVNEVLQQEIMVSYVKSLGYEVSENEFEDYKKSLVDSLQASDNYNEIANYFDGFGGINEYFSSMEHRLKDSLLVRKFLDDERIRYANLNGYDEKDADFVEIWNQKENEIIKEQMNNNHISDEKKQQLLEVATEYLSDKAK